MTEKEAKQRVAKIRESTVDPEAAHSLEDELYVDLVRHVSKSGDIRLKRLANIILKTRDIDFERWSG